MIAENKETLLHALPGCGFLFPAFRDRSSDTERINVFAADGNFGKAGEWGEILFSGE